MSVGGIEFQKILDGEYQTKEGSINRWNFFSDV